MWKRNSSKYNAQRVNGSGSKLEKAVHEHLKLLEKTGSIKIIQTQASVNLIFGSKKWRCIPDFKIELTETNEIVYVEAKGMETDRWKATKFLWSVIGPAPMEVWKGSYKKIYLDEIIIPEGL